MERYLFTEIFKSNTLQLLNATKFSQCIGRIEILYHCIFFVNERQFALTKISYFGMGFLRVKSTFLLANKSNWGDWKNFAA